MNQTNNNASDIPTRPSLTPAAQSPAHRSPLQPSLKVLGLGGGGGNAVNRMIELGLQGVEFIVANTDRQVLEQNLAPNKILLGPKTTRGLGAGGNPAVGHAAAEESRKDLAAALEGADMVFLTAGMGGGTGTGSISVAAEIARSLGAVTIAVVSMPFSFEMGRRQQNARTGLRCLRPHTDTLISIPNDRLLTVQNGNLTLDLAFRLADDILRQGVQGIAELASHPGTINVDFANIRHLMKLGGGALMAIGQGRGDGKALQAIHQAIHHPLLDIGSIENAAGLLVNFTSGDDLTLFEVEAALTELQNQAGGQAEIVFGVVNDPQMQDRLEAILVVTGLGAPTLEEAFGQAPAQAFQSAPPRPNAQTIQTSSPLETVSVEAGLTMPVPVSKNLDIPAFMRRTR